MIDLVLRPAEAADFEQVRALVMELENQHFDKNIFLEYYQRLLANGQSYMIIAELNGQAVGFMGLLVSFPLHHCEPIAEVTELIVKGAHRSQKIGERLISHAKELAQEHGWAALELSSNMLRTHAHAFYLRNGFAKRHFKFSWRG